jgi:hypothetical protein
MRLRTLSGLCWDVTFNTKSIRSSIDLALVQSSRPSWKEIYLIGCKPRAHPK